MRDENPFFNFVPQPADDVLAEWTRRGTKADFSFSPPMDATDPGHTLTFNFPHNFKYGILHMVPP